MPSTKTLRYDDPAFYLDDPNAAFRALREEDPVHWYDEGQFWVITKYDDIKSISAHPERFTSERIGIMSDLISKRNGVDPHNYGQRGIMFMDPPEHRSHRRAVGVHFTPALINGMEQRVRSIVHEVLDALPAGEFDWIGCVAEPLPVFIFSDLLGIPKGDWQKIAGWATVIASVGGGTSTDADMEVIFGEVAPYLLALIEDRKGHPTDDLLSMLIAVDIDGVPFDDFQTLVYALVLLAAGSETTQSLIAGMADCLDQHPEQAERLFADPQLSAGAVEETLRWWTPVMSMARQAANDVEIRGKTIRKGDGLLLAYASANRDEDRWGPSAEAFDVTRPDSAGHLGFGIGEHFCMGAALARREVRVLFDELAVRAKGLEVVGDREPRVSTLIHTHDRLPVRLTY